MARKMVRLDHVENNSMEIGDGNNLLEYALLLAMQERGRLSVTQFRNAVQRLDQRRQERMHKK